MGLFSKIGSYITGNPLTDKLMGGDNGAGKAFDANQQLAKDQSSKMTDLGASNNQYMQNLAGQVLGGYKNFNLNVDNTVNSALQGIDKSQKTDEAKLASMGYTPGSNNAFSNLYSDYASKKATTEEGIRNNANQMMFQNQMNATGLAGNIYNQGYNNQMNAMNGAYGMQAGANNALGAYLSQQAQNKWKNMGSIIGGMGGMFTGMGGIGGIAGTGTANTPTKN